MVNGNQEHNASHSQSDADNFDGNGCHHGCQLSVSDSVIWLSPAQAALKASVSRGTIMNAIKGKSLEAVRNNRNAWQISEEALAEWLSGRDRVADKEVSVVTDMAVTEAANPDSEALLVARLENAEMRGKLEAQERLIARLEAELAHAQRPLWKRLLG